MRITASEEYGLRCILQLARLPQGERLSAAQIGNREGISAEYAGKMMHLFRKAGLVAGERGPHGGFSLAREASRTTLLDVFMALGKQAKGDSFCDKFAGDRAECVHVKDCSVRPVWHVLVSLFDSLLGELSLADLVGGEAQTRRALLAKAAPLQGKKMALARMDLGQTI